MPRPQIFTSHDLNKYDRLALAVHRARARGALGPDFVEGTVDEALDGISNAPSVICDEALKGVMFIVETEARSIGHDGNEAEAMALAMAIGIFERLI